MPISALASVSCLHSRRQHISDQQHLPGQRDISEKLCLKMQKLTLFRSRDPGAFVRETFALAAGEWVDGVLFSAGWQQLRLRTADLHLYAGPGSMRSQLHRINEHKERSSLCGCTGIVNAPRQLAGEVWPLGSSASSGAFDLCAPAALTVTLVVKSVTESFSGCGKMDCHEDESLSQQYNQS